MGNECLKFGDCACLVRRSVQPGANENLRYIGLEHIEQDSLKLNGMGSSSDVTSTKSAFNKGDILFGKLRPYFRKAVIAPVNGVCSTDIWVVRSKPSIDQEFLFYWMASSSFVDFATAGSEGTRMPRAKWDHVGNHSIPWFDIGEQRRIAQILGTLDDKIELNRQMNETLEAMAQALFKSWFVDFDPVIDKALASGKEIPKPLQEKVARREALGDKRKPLPADIAALFPDEFEESELGWIPKGWEFEKLQNVLENLISGSRQKGGAIDKGIPSIGAENIIGLGKYNFSKDKFISIEHFEKLKQKGANVQNRDVLLYKDGAQIGRKTYFDASFPHKECAVNEHVFILRAKDIKLQRYMYLWLDQDWMTKEIIALNSNSAQPGINQKGVSSLKLLLPSTELLRIFDEIIATKILKIFENCKDSQLLTNIRETLLPKLISGEIGIPDDKAIIEESLNV